MLRSFLFSSFLVAALAATPVPALAQFDTGSAPPPPGMGAPYAAAAPTDLQVRMNALETHLRNVTGQMERAEYQNNQLQQALRRMNTDYDGRFRLLEKRLDALEARAAAPPPSPPPAAPSAVMDVPREEPRAETPEQVLGTFSSAGDEEGAQALYDKAFASLRQARYGEAEQLLRRFLKTYSRHRLAENAKYWLGETYYVRGKFQDAAIAFAEGFQRFPKGRKAPDNLLKLAMSLGASNQKKDACTTLSELSKRFPNASAIIRNRAAQEKRTLGCAS